MPNETGLAIIKRPNSARQESRTMSLATPAQTIAVLKRFNLRLTKRLGQNFLVDENILKKTGSLAEFKPNDIILEIGPGIGTLTQLLASNSRAVLAIEYDRKFLPVLKETLSSFNNVTVFQSDALDFDLTSVVSEPMLPNKMVSNLPYNIAVPLLVKCLQKHPFLKTFVVMVQKEIAMRMMAEPATKDYSAVTLLFQYYCRIYPGFSVSRNVFLPSPNVDSAVVKLERLDFPRINVGNQELLFDLIKAAFAQRRKTIRNTLVAGTNFNPGEVESVLEKNRVDLSRRGETLTLEEFGALCLGFEQLDFS